MLWYSFPRNICVFWRTCHSSTDVGCSLHRTVSQIACRANLLSVQEVIIMCFFPLRCLSLSLPLSQGPGCTKLPSRGEPCGKGGWFWLESADDRRHVHSSCWRQVPHQVDRTGEPGLQHLFHQIRRLGSVFLLPSVIFFHLSYETMTKF